MADNGIILKEIKKMLGPEEDYDHFDQDIMIHINTAFNTLRQLGVGPKSGFALVTGNETWDDFFNGAQEVPMVKTYIYATVKLVFDPPASSFVMEALKEFRKEFEWRCNVDVETPCFAKEGD